jgi:hypothetical protein
VELHVGSSASMERTDKKQILNPLSLSLIYIIKKKNDELTPADILFFLNIISKEFRSEVKDMYSVLFPICL